MDDGQNFLGIRRASFIATDSVLHFVGVSVDPVGEDEKCRSPEPQKDTEKLGMGASLESCFMAAVEQPDDDGRDDGGKAKHHAEIADEFQEGWTHRLIQRPLQLRIQGERRFSLLVY